MSENKFKDIAQDILSSAGITINSDKPWDIRIRDDRFYHRVMSDGSLGLGETYMDGCGIERAGFAWEGTVQRTTR